MPINTAWFRDRIADRQMSQRALARAMGLDSSAVSLLLRGKREMKLTEAAEIARLIGVPVSDVLENAGVRMSGASVQITGYVDGHGEGHCMLHEPIATIPHPGADLPGNINALQCRTAGTELDHMDGWLLFVPDAHHGIPPEAIGRLSMCKIKDGVTYLAKPTRSYARGRWDLTGPATKAQGVQIEYAMPVLLIAT